MNPNLEDGLPLTAYLTPEEKKELARRLEEGWREYVGPDRFEEDQEKFKPPAWLSNLPRMPERDSYGRLPDLG